METTIEVSEASQVAEVRRVVAELARVQGMGVADTGRATLVATEASTNILKYGKGGAVTVSAFAEGRQGGIQIIAVDRGPGFVNFGASARDGHSTGGSLGIGLGAIMRAATEFDIYTAEGQGTAMLARVSATAPVASPSLGLVHAARSSPKRGQEHCGDAWAVAQSGRWQRFCVVDGLGHGPLAARASGEAVAVLHAAGAADSPAAIVTRIHEALKSTRGAVIGVACIDTASAICTFCGVGNIAAAICTAASTQHLLSMEGIVGYNMRPPREHSYPWPAGAALVLSSDGLSARWNLARYPGLLERHPALVASVLFRDFARDTDDATVLVGKGAA